MPGFLPDTSCIVPAVCAWHVHHQPALAEIERRLDRREKMFAAAPALVEAYAVLTRLPPPHRLSPENACTLLEASFIRSVKVVTLDGKSYCSLLHSAPADGIAGGRTYDAVIAACAVRAKVKTLLTFNAGHFLAFSDRGLEIVVPGVGS